MNIIYFIRLLLKHIYLLILGPILLFAIIFYSTKDEPKQYTSATNIYTGIASGASLTSLESSKVDRLSTMIAFDNLINIVKSRETLEEVGLKLFTSHMILENAVPEIISRESYSKLIRIVPHDVKDLVVKNDFDKTYKAFKKYKEKDFNNFIYELIALNHPDYSSGKISGKLKARRLNSSDMLEISYRSTDPGICQKTLEILTDVFITNYSSVKINQSDAILGYFQSQLDDAQLKLDEAEEELLQFNKTNNIINYYEQTEHIVGQKELFSAKYNEIKMEYAASESVLKVLENKLTAQQKKQINNANILELRDKLASINLQIATKEYQARFDTLNENKYTNEIAALNAESLMLQQELRNSIDKSYFIDNSIDGITSTSVLVEWLEEVVNYEASKAKLLVGAQRQKEFDDLVSDLAPKGATMKRLERKINIAEREYLSILNSLNVAKLRQQNIELNSNLKVLEPPIFPKKSEPSKRKMLLLMGLMIGFILPASLVIILDFLDQNIKSASRAEKLTGLKVAAIFPRLKKVGRSMDIETIKSAGLDAIDRRLIFNKEQIGESNYQVNTNLFFSLQGSEGKTTLLELLLEKLADIGYKTMYLSPDHVDAINGVEIINYKIDNSFHKVANIAELHPDLQHKNMDDYDFVIVEIPGIINNAYPINLFRVTDHSFAVTRANRAWSKSDENALQDILEVVAENKPQIILNGVEIQEMENIMGDLPRSRSYFRRLIKDIIQLRFFSKSEVAKLSKKERKKREDK